MVRELPLLLGGIGMVLGCFTLPYGFFSLSLSGYYTGYAPSVSDELSALAWTVAPFLGLAGAFRVKKNGKLGGILFIAAGVLPWFGFHLLLGLAAFFWTPFFFVAGVLAILNWPGPYVEKEEVGGEPQEAATE